MLFFVWLNVFQPGLFTLCVKLGEIQRTSWGMVSANLARVTLPKRLLTCGTGNDRGDFLTRVVFVAERSLSLLLHLPLFLAYNHPANSGLRKSLKSVVHDDT